MTPTEQLNRASETLLRLADEATPGPWADGMTTFGDPTDGPTHVCIRREGARWTEHLFAVEGCTQSARDAAFIALMDPDLARMLAVWLAEVADRADEIADSIGSEAVAQSVIASNVTGWTSALALAEHINERASQ